MAEVLTWLGAALLVTGLGGLAFDGLLLGILTPTRKSPDRPGDEAARRLTRASIKVAAVGAAAGAALLMSGIAVHVAA